MQGDIESLLEDVADTKSNIYFFTTCWPPSIYPHRNYSSLLATPAGAAAASPFRPPMKKILPPPSILRADIYAAPMAIIYLVAAEMMRLHFRQPRHYFEPFHALAIDEPLMKEYAIYNAGARGCIYIHIFISAGRQVELPDIDDAIDATTY